MYRVYLYPLSKFPGPRIYAASSIPREYAVTSGRYHYTTKSLHEKYGNAVRIGINELSFTSAQALKDIYTRHCREGVCPKDAKAYARPQNRMHSILSAIDDADHSRYRRLFNHAFSEKALQEQAPLLKKYIDLLMVRLYANADEVAQDMVAWFNWIASTSSEIYP